MDQHNKEVMEMEDLLEQHLSEVNEDHQIKVSLTTPTCVRPHPLSHLVLSDKPIMFSHSFVRSFCNKLM